MKWQIVDQFRDEVTKKGGRAHRHAGHRSSSQPNSPLTRAPFSTQTYNHKTNGGPPQRDLEGAFNAAHVPIAPRSTTPPNHNPLSTQTPIRSAQSQARTGRRGRHSNVNTPVKGETSAFPPYIDSPTAIGYVEANNDLSLVTPAPQKQNPQLAPPSTAQMPSMFMEPTSSPAPFWNYLNIDSTPARLDLRKDGQHITSSSPPVHTQKEDDETYSGSPLKFRSRAARKQLDEAAAKNGNDTILETSRDDEKKEESAEVKADPEKAEDQIVKISHGDHNDNGDDRDVGNDGEGGIDLAKGFEPIGLKSRASQRNE